MRALTLLLFINTIAAYCQIPLWPDRAPGANGAMPEDIPTVTPMLADASKFSGTSIVLFPGGAYVSVATEVEGTPVAKWLNDLGINVFLVKYRYAPYKYPIEINDGYRAIRYVKAKAKEWNVDTTKLGIMGFSAGGHLSSTIITHPISGNKDTADVVERYSSKVNFAMLIYPVITMNLTYTHAFSRTNLLGNRPPASLVDYLSNERHVTGNTPKNFLIHSTNDDVVPVQNSIMFHDSCVQKGVSSTLHLLNVQGNLKHGFGLGNNDPSASIWQQYAIKWLDSLGYINTAVLNTETKDEENLLIYPTIITDNNIYLRNSRPLSNILIYNCLGDKFQFSLTTSKELTVIDIGAFPSGAYLLHVMLEGGKRQMRSFVKI
ncbi:MAG TPA: alpha/beta hydrolase [Cytophagaceae bacterium]